MGPLGAKKLWLPWDLPREIITAICQTVLISVLGENNHCKLGFGVFFPFLCQTERANCFLKKSIWERERETWISCLLNPPCLGIEPVTWVLPWLGTKPTIWCLGGHSNHLSLKGQERTNWFLIEFFQRNWFLVLIDQPSCFLFVSILYFTSSFIYFLYFPPLYWLKCLAHLS